MTYKNKSYFFSGFLVKNFSKKGGQVKILTEKLTKADPEDALMLKELILKNNKNDIIGILSARMACHMDPEHFVKILEKGDLDGALAISKRALEIKNLIFEIAQI